MEHRKETHPSMRRIGGLLLYELSSVHEHVIGKMLAPSGIGRRELRVLWTIALSERAPTQQEIADTTCLSGSSIVLAIDALEKLGVVRRTQNSDNRRENLVSITPEGRRKLRSWQRLLQEERSETFGGLTAEEYETLCDLLIKALDGTPSARKASA